VQKKYVGALHVYRDLDLLSGLFFHVVFEIFNDIFNSRLDHARAGAEFQVLHRTLFVDLGSSYAKLLAEDLPQLVRDQHVVYPDGAHLSTAAAH
jgi:hypothetical protein